MGLETVPYIDGLVVTNPLSTDKRRFGDDHLRLIKTVLKNSFPTVDGPVTPTVAELNFLAGVTSLIQAQLDAKLPTADLDGLVLAYEYAVRSALNVWSATQALAPIDLGSVSGVTELDVLASDSYVITLVADATLVFSNTQAGQSLTIKVIQGGSGSNLLTWPGTMHFANKTVPVLSTVLGDYDVVVAKQIDGRFIGNMIRDVGI